MRSPRFVAGIIGGALGLVVLTAILLVLLAPHGARVDSFEPPVADLPTWAPPGPEPVVAADPGDGVQGRVDADWAEQTAAATGIPIRALVAYAGAALFKAHQMPECGISWSTLAGIGKIESDHGRFGGSVFDADGTSTPPIYGIALDGGSTNIIPDSDDGEIDGDAEFDRAVGPMQLIPETWRNWHVDGGDDGVEDPQNIDDAVTAAANYLCRSSLDMDTEEGWRAAVGAYNSSDVYLSNVAAVAVGYNEAAG
jgi:membrane-bound lytic murein transglycosylase B